MNKAEWIIHYEAVTRYHPGEEHAEQWWAYSNRRNIFEITSYGPTEEQALLNLATRMNWKSWEV